MSLFGSLGVGMAGLKAAQVSIDVTGQNISNINTEGYSRKRADLQAGAVRHEIFGQIGLGVDVDSVSRVRDEFLDRQTWEQMGEKGMYTQLNAAMTRLENILKEPTDSGLAKHMSEFFASWEDLANNPGDLSSREAVKASALTLTDVFHSVYKQVEDYGLSMNNPLSQKTTLVNDYTSQIYALNEKVAGAEIRPGQKANDARDQRDLVVRKLAELMDVQTVEDGDGRVIVTSSGNLLVGPSEAMKVETYGVDKTLSDGTLTTELRLRFSASRRNFEPRGGELKGIMDARSEVLTKYMGNLNELAKTIVEKVNSLHQSGYNLNKNTGVLFFDPGKVKASDMALSAAVLEGSSNIAAAKGGKIVDVTAFPVAVPASASPSFDLKTLDPAYRNLALGTIKLTLASGAVLEEGAGKDFVMDYDKGVVTFLNYARYAPGDAVNVKLQYNTTGFPGNGNGQNALEIGQLATKTTMGLNAEGKADQSMSEFYSGVIAMLGIEKNQNSSRLETKEFLIAQMDAEQQSISGVSMDEELANMIKFENSYQASAKFIATINSMIDVLMNI